MKNEFVMRNAYKTIQIIVLQVNEALGYFERKQSWDALQRGIGEAEGHWYWLTAGI